MPQHIQCKDQAEAEKINTVAAFMSPDFRLYETITLMDDASYMEIDAATLVALYHLQSNLELLQDDSFEMSFGKLAQHLKDFDEDWARAMKAIRFKPILTKSRK